MNTLSQQVNELKMQYRKAFSESCELIAQKVEETKPLEPCSCCSSKECDKKGDIFEEFPKNCAYKNWQKDVLSFFEKTKNEVHEQWLNILIARKNFDCKMCATCCKLACSEFSYEELKAKARSGDSFAKQFISVFTPYESESQAREIYPEYFDLLKEEKVESKVFFYYCPKVTTNNHCSDYENRPAICKDFPDNPLGFLPKSCGYNEWKNNAELSVVKLHAMLEVIEYYNGKIAKL